MRTEDEIMKLLINTAAQDERIRAAYLEGSRVNPDVPRDMFQDYDVVYIVKETASFQKDTAGLIVSVNGFICSIRKTVSMIQGIKKTVTGALCS